jgi:hypothetical protein
VQFEVLPRGVFCLVLGQVTVGSAISWKQRKLGGSVAPGFWDYSCFTEYYSFLSTLHSKLVIII